MTCATCGTDTDVEMYLDEPTCEPCLAEWRRKLNAPVNLGLDARALDLLGFPEGL